jgi:hypothetical protein
VCSKIFDSRKCSVQDEFEMSNKGCLADLDESNPFNISSMAAPVAMTPIQYGNSNSLVSSKQQMASVVKPIKLERKLVQQRVTPYIPTARSNK